MLQNSVKCQHGLPAPDRLNCNAGRPTPGARSHRDPVGRLLRNLCWREQRAGSIAHLSSIATIASYRVIAYKASKRQRCTNRRRCDE